MCVRGSSMLCANNSKIRKSDTCSTRIVANNYRRYQMCMTMIIITVDGIRCEMQLLKHLPKHSVTKQSTTRTGSMKTIRRCDV